MATQVYKTLSKIVGILLALVGIAALFGAMFANSFIRAQFEDQHIVFPSADTINSQVEQGRLSEEDGAAMLQYADEVLLNGDQAIVFADNFILPHMLHSAKQAGLEGTDATYEGTGEPVNKAEAELAERIKADNPNDDDDTIELKAQAEMADPLSEYPEARRAAELNLLRNDVFFKGNAIRGMLLNAYGWGLIAKIANFAGIALLIIGIILAIWGFVPSKKKSTETAEATA